jgi:hypothetical protein
MAVICRRWQSFMTGSFHTTKKLRATMGLEQDYLISDAGLQ